MPIPLVSGFTKKYNYLLAELNYRYRRLVRTNFMDFAYF